MRVNHWVAAIGCIVLIAAQMVWYFIDMPSLYYWADAVFKAAILYSYSRLLKSTSFGAFLFFDFIFNLAVGNLIDEVLFNPELVQINEYVCFAATAVIFIFRWLSHATRLKPLDLFKHLFGYGKFH